MVQPILAWSQITSSKFLNVCDLTDSSGNAGMELEN